MTGGERSVEFDGLSAQDLDELRSVVDRLERATPGPRAGFRSALRARLVELEASDRRGPAHLRFALAVYCGSGALLLALAAVGVAGVGPLGY